MEIAELYLTDVNGLKKYSPFPSDLTLDNKLGTLLLDAQENFLQPKLGNDFYYDIVINKTSLNNILLINGGYYKDQEQLDKYFNGLVKPLSFYTYSYFLETNGIEGRSKGNVKYVNGQFEEDAGDGDWRIKKMVSFYRNKANSALSEVILFLNNKSENYPLFKKEEITDSRNNTFIGGL